MKQDKIGDVKPITFILLIIIALTFILSGFLFDYVQKRVQKNNEENKFKSEHIYFNGEWCNELRLCTPYRGDIDCFTTKKFEDIYNTCDLNVDDSTCSNSKYTYRVDCL